MSGIIPRHYPYPSFILSQGLSLSSELTSQSLSPSSLLAAGLEMHVLPCQALCVDAGVRTQVFIAGTLRTESSHQPLTAFYSINRDGDRKIAGLKVMKKLRGNVGQKGAGRVLSS